MTFCVTRFELIVICNTETYRVYPNPKCALFDETVLYILLSIYRCMVRMALTLYYCLCLCLHCVCVNKCDCKTKESVRYLKMVLCWCMRWYDIEYIWNKKVITVFFFCWFLVFGYIVMVMMQNVMTTNSFAIVHILVSNRIPCNHFAIHSFHLSIIGTFNIKENGKGMGFVW